MVKDMQGDFSSKKVLLHVVDKLADLNTEIGSNPLVNFFNKYYGGDAGAFVDLGFDETNLTTGLTPSARFGQRLDHVSTDFTLTFPKVTSDITDFLGTEDSVGTSNAGETVSNPDFSTMEVTIKGMPFDLERLFMADAVTTPAGYVTYTGGSRPDNFSIIVGLISDYADVTHADAVTQLYFLNDVTVLDAGSIKQSGGGAYERTFTVQCKAGNLRSQNIVAQNTNDIINV